MAVYPAVVLLKDYHYSGGDVRGISLDHAHSGGGTGVYGGYRRRGYHHCLCRILHGVGVGQGMQKKIAERRKGQWYVTRIVSIALMTIVLTMR